MLLGINDWIFQPTHKNEYESNSFRNRLFWRETFWMSTPGINLIVLVIFAYVVVVGYKNNG
jgi:hypothetical protein